MDFTTPEVVSNIVAFIRGQSIKARFFFCLLIVDLLINWYIYSEHPPVPVNQRCSPKYRRIENDSILAQDGTVYSYENFVQECPCRVKPCIPKCCLNGEAFNQEFKCVNITASPKFSFIKKLMTSDIYKLNVTKKHFSVHYSQCDIGPTGNKRLINISLLQDGKVQHSSGILDQTRYCLETFSHFQEPYSKNDKIVAVSCLKHEDFDEFIESIRQLMANSLRALSTTLHLITFVIYVLLPRLRQGMGRLLVRLAGAMFCKGLFNIIVIARLGHQHRFLCIAIGLGMQYSWLACQTWQTVISYRIWNTFRAGSTCSRGPDGSHFQLCRGLGWGLPLLVSVLTLIADFTPLLPDSLKPQLGVDKCWFSTDQYTRFIYAVIPVDITEIINLIFCVATLQQLRGYELNSADLQGRQHNVKEYEWSKIYTRACFVMGSAYILVTVIGLITWNYKIMMGIPLFLVKTVADIERMRGVEVFFIFVFQKNVLLQLCNKL